MSLLYRLCGCGCGLPTKLATSTNARRGTVKGQPASFLQGHNRNTPRLSVERRFWMKVEKTDSCWQWTGAMDPRGYGNFGMAMGDTRRAHRLAYELCVGPIPDGLVLDHLCRNHSCVNPEHLEPVTTLENFLRGQGYAALRHAAGECLYGHVFTPENTYTRPGTTRRVCRACQRERDRRRRQRARSVV